MVYHYEIRNSQGNFQYIFPIILIYKMHTYTSLQDTLLNLRGVTFTFYAAIKCGFKNCSVWSFLSITTCHRTLWPIAIWRPLTIDCIYICIFIYIIVLHRNPSNTNNIHFIVRAFEWLLKSNNYKKLTWTCNVIAYFRFFIFAFTVFAPEKGLLKDCSNRYFFSSTTRLRTFGPISKGWPYTINLKILILR